jgi:hypothetical protein
MEIVREKFDKITFFLNKRKQWNESLLTISASTGSGFTLMQQDDIINYFLLQF